MKQLTVQTISYSYQTGHWPYRIRSLGEKFDSQSILLCDSETCPLRTEDLGELVMFKYRGLHSFGEVRWKNFSRNPEIKPKVLGSMAQSLEKALNLNELRQLGHLLCRLTERLPYRAIHPETGSV